MPRWLSVLLVFVCPAIVVACNDDVEQDVPQDVCVSGKQWIGGRRGSPHMFPGRDCVGCHLENDGPQLMLGGTVYPYVENELAGEGLAQTGEDCFGVAGVNVQVTGGDGQLFDLFSNEAGNFFVEGNPEELQKPFKVVLKWKNVDGNDQTTPMFTQPSYGGCAQCHTLGVTAYTPMEDESKDKQVIDVKSKIGLPGNLPGYLESTAP